MAQPQKDTRAGAPHAQANDSYFIPADAWARVRSSMLFIAIVGWIGALIGFASEPESFFSSYLVAFLFCISIAIGAAFFVMVEHLTGSAWSVTVRRLMEALMRTMPLFLLLFAPLTFGLHYLYAWSHADAAQDPLLKLKLGYLNEQWFTIRGCLIIGLFSLWALILYNKSRRQDDSGSVRLTFSAGRWSGPGLLLLFIGGSVGAFDWIMSLDARWYSTMFGVIFLSGGAMGFMAVLIIVCLCLRANGYLVNAVTTEHYHDLGKWLFTLMVFWAYVAFSQYMLIWYGNMPEETIWFKRRLDGSWLYVALLLIVGHFLFPLFAMLPRAVKRNRGALAFFAGWMLLMHYVDLYWQVMPVFHARGFGMSWLSPVCLVAVGATMGLAFWSSFRERPLVPVGDPRLKQCLAFHNA
jgi:hypothetical protein